MNNKKSICVLGVILFFAAVVLYDKMLSGGKKLVPTNCCWSFRRENVFLPETALL